MTAVNNILMGTNDEGEKFFLSFSYERENRETLNIKHEHISNYTRISFSGTLVSKYGSVIHDRGIRSWGQNPKELLRITHPAKGYTLASIKEIYNLWERYHLNDLNSHCEHQDKAIKWDEVAPCPITGYKAGSNWLVQEITREELDSIFSKVVKQNKAVA